MSRSDDPYVKSSDSVSSPKPSENSGWLTARVGLTAIVWLFILGCIATMVIAQWKVVGDDYAVANIVTVLGGFLAVIGLGLWFAFLSPFAVRIRLLTCAAAMIVLVIVAASFRVDHVSGESIPVFRPRWSKKADQMLERPVAAGDVTKLSLVAQETDFPQFLGPDRNARVDYVELNRDWTQNPPKVLWRKSIGAGWSAFSVVGEYAFTLEQRGDEEFVTCYEVDTGKLVWSHATKARHETIPGGVGPRSTPTIDGQLVYTQGATGEVLCLDGTTGKVVWRDNLLQRYEISPADDMKRIAWGRAGSPLIVDDLVVVPAGGRPSDGFVSLIAYDKTTGKVAWEAGKDQISYSSPVLVNLAGVRQIVIVNEKTVTSHQPATGTQLWEMSWPGNSNGDTNASQAVPIQPDTIFVSKGYAKGAAFMRLAGSPDQLTVADIHSDTSILKTKFTNVVVYDGHIYGLSDGVLECVDIATRTRQWKKGRYGQGQILGVRDLILVQAENGDVAMVEASPAGFNELGRFSAIEGITWNNLCLTGNKLLVRNAEEAACYELP